MDLSDLKLLRERSGMTQEDIAIRLGTTKGSISNWEANPQNLSIIKLKQYLDVVGGHYPTLKKRKRYNNEN
ncbi:helix-turn-helix domain-containing protein [Lactococcus lactis]|nr:helix-turn-helix domain-containing protein [Lactococcus lactis]